MPGSLLSLRQLRFLHRPVAGEPIGPGKLDTFRCRMQKHLEPTDPEEHDPGDGLGRPALLVHRIADDE
jgi:hypothetical protein